MHIYRTVETPPPVEPDKSRLTRSSSSIPHVAKDGPEVTEKHHATHALLAPAVLAPPPCREVGATAQPRPVRDRWIRDGHAPMNRASTRIPAVTSAQPAQSPSPPDQ
ncbi:hypothetical protein GCM10010211_16910 [Streptomyces albospinus]|uniref:Uncharacterized protein n=1 Tax=Streptomyces albospinus TaxID=285515 RepID=A0ABQ2UTF6_9ACTN|nr:hypothetical protein GCM10010211_16910 [Streptomyces albospinus]